MKIIDRKSNSSIEKILISSGISPLLANILSKRNINSVDELDMSTSKLLSPWKLLNIEKAAELLGNATIKKKLIIIVADFDTDGATGCAISILGLKKFNSIVDFIVPDRFTFGYGLTPDLVHFLVDKFNKKYNKFPDLLLTVDNGISSHEGVLIAKKLGVEVLITDHHLPGSSLPKALIVNPQQRGCSFESKNIAGVGVVFYVLVATRAWLRKQNYFLNFPEPNLDDLLSFVALGTIADLVPLDLNNRRIVAQGLRRFKLGLINSGLKALLKVSNLSYSDLVCSDLSFKIAPKINAAGRLSDMSIGIQCLIEDNEKKALSFAMQLDELNKKRREIEGITRGEAMNLVANEKLDDESLGVILFKKNWHQGVIGLVANKVKDLLTKPTIAFGYHDENHKILKGSGRSINGLHLRDVLERVSMRTPNLIINFGGHAMAAGMTIYEEQLDEFKVAFNKALREFSDKSIYSPILHTDGKIDLMEINIELVSEVKNTIWGQSFEPPIFHDEFTIHEKKILKEKHLKLTVSQSSKRESFNKYEAIWFDAPKITTNKISVAYELNINKWLGNESIQIIIKENLNTKN